MLTVILLDDIYQSIVTKKEKQNIRRVVSCIETSH